MYLAYLDESGDPGPIATSPSKFYVVACVLVQDRAWHENLEKLVKLRRWLRAKYGIRARDEIKATDIRRGQGPLSPLRWSLDERMTFYRVLLHIQARMNLKSFAVAIDKGKLAAGRDPREVAWQYTFQRVDSFCKSVGELATLFPDAGNGYFLRGLLRRVRKRQHIAGRYGGLLSIPAQRIVEDPNERASHDSYFIQLADWNAYAAHRSSYVAPGPVTGLSNVWDSLGSARLLEVNKLLLRTVPNAPPGIVRYPYS